MRLPVAKVAGFFRVCYFTSLQVACASIDNLSSLQNAMTSSEERTSAEAEGYRIERALMDCVAPP